MTRILLLFVTASIFGCASSAGAPGGDAYAPMTVRLDTAAVCHACFWNHQDPALRHEVIAVLSERRPADPLLVAEHALIVARVRADSAAVCHAGALFAAAARGESDAARLLLMRETEAFLAAQCGADPSPHFRVAAEAARNHGQTWKAEVYNGLAAGAFRPKWAPNVIRTNLNPPRNATGYVLGGSTIRIDGTRKVVTQVERVARDWLSYQLSYDFRGTIDAGATLDYHEGSRIRALGASTPLQVHPVSGVLAIQVGAHWYTADDAGVFRFQVLPDKVQYPATRAWNGVALLVDTHGIAALVEPALRLGAQLVIGCGDDIGKMEAAFFLAQRGIDVYYPTDDYAADVIGYDAPGVLLGSAPLRVEAGVTIIGDRPVRFRMDEPIIVQSAEQLRSGALRYYHAPAKYYAQLARLLGLQVEYVDVADAGQAGRIIDRATERNAHAVALRVWNEADYAPVRAWLAASPANRAVLLHSIAYPAGVRLFAEFPQQTTFADPRPQFY